MRTGALLTGVLSKIVENLALDVLLGTAFIDEQILPVPLKE